MGPDNLCFLGGAAFVIEAKNENQDSLHKSDSGQMHDSLQWARDNYPEYADRFQPLTVAKVWMVDRDAHYAAGTCVLAEDGCTALGIDH